MGLGQDLYDYSIFGDKGLVGQLNNGQGLGGLARNSLNRTSGTPDLDPNNFNLPGQQRRGQNLLQQADFAAGRGAPQIAGSTFRGDQQGLISMLQEQAAGRGPSAAGMQLRDALGRNVSTQQSLLATGGPAGARQASMMAGQLGGSIANQTAQARVQEQLGAQGLLSQTLQGARGLDLQRQGMMSDAELKSRGLNDQQIARLRELELRNAQLQQQGTMGLEGQQTVRRGQDLGVPTAFETIVGAAGPVLAGM